MDRIERRFGTDTLTWEIAGRPPVLLLTVKGDVDGETVLEAQREVVRRGWYGHGLPSLFDVRDFTGHMSWPQLLRLNRIRQVATPGESTRVAVVTHDISYHAFSRLIAATTPKLKVRFYATVEEGLRWVHPDTRAVLAAEHAEAG
ncbi:MAG TPA: hypothetical protein VED40_01405 [Azospirillaceae bacterium]|nr:hypothetical protein [Azospirillaceae bacterium]